MLNTTGMSDVNVEKSILELLLNNLELFLILDPLTFGFLLRSADFLLLATFINTMTNQKAQLMSTTDLTSTSPMVLVQCPDLSVKIQFM